MDEKLNAALEKMGLQPLIIKQTFNKTYSLKKDEDFENAITVFSDIKTIFDELKKATQGQELYIEKINIHFDKVENKAVFSFNITNLPF